MSTRYPLSFSQLGIWLACAIDATSPAYNTVYAWDLTGEIDGEIVKACFQALQFRHEILRTHYIFERDQPWQVIDDSLSLDFESLDIRNSSLETLTNDVAKVAKLPFDLEHGPIFRIRLYRISHSVYQLILVIHHIAADLWSIKILMNEFWMLYFSKKMRLASSRPDARDQVTVNLSLPRISYVDYVKLHREMLLLDEGANLFEYWRKQLAGDLSILNLAGEQSGNNFPSFRGTTYQLKLHAEFVEDARRFCKRNKLSLFSLLFASYQSFLAQYLEQNDIIIGTPMIGWRRHMYRALVGNLVNIVPIRTHFKKQTPFITLASELAHLIHMTFKHQGFPYIRMVNELVTQTTRIHAPLLQTIFVFHSQNFFFAHDDIATPSNSLQSQEQKITVTPKLLTQQEGQFQLAIQICEMKESLLLDFRYDNAIMNKERVTELAKQYQNHLLNCIAEI